MEMDVHQIRKTVLKTKPQSKFSKNVLLKKLKNIFVHTNTHTWCRQISNHHSSVVFDNQSALQQFRNVELANPIGDDISTSSLSEDNNSGGSGLGPLSPAANSIAAFTNQE
jgi:hypothetical protein